MPGGKRALAILAGALVVSGGGGCPNRSAVLPDVPTGPADLQRGAGRRLGIACHHSFPPNTLDRAVDRPEVPHAVVEDRDPLHSDPFVDGAPPRPVSAHASPSARASALNSDSTT